MPTFNIAHVREQGQDMIIVPLSHEFELKTDVEKEEVMTEFQLRSRAAGLAGRVVLVWDAGGGRTRFIAPQPWHPFFQSISLSQIQSALNRTLSW